MTTVMRFLFALLLGVLAGAGGTIYLIQSDAGNLLVRRTQVVEDLDRHVRELEDQRNQMSRQLEDVVARSAKMEQAFTELERRFRGMAEDRPAPPTPAQPPAQTP